MILQSWIRTSWRYRRGWSGSCGAAWRKSRREDSIRHATWDLRWRRSRAPDYCFPSRLEEMIVLEAALHHDADDARAHYYLGNLLYDKYRREEAVEHWEQACRLDPEFSIPWRNLGMAYYNVRRQPDRATECYEKAVG